MREQYVTDYSHGKPVSFTPQFITIATTEAQPGLRTFEVFSCTPGHEKAVMKKRL